MKYLSVLLFWAVVVASPSAQTSSTVNVLGAVSSSTVLSGLGWSLQPTNPEEFVAAAAAGSTHVRLDTCGWNGFQTGSGVNNLGVEQQSAPPANTSSGIVLQANCISGLSLAATYGMLPSVVAAYGAPFHQILAVTVTSNVAVGATSVPITFASGYGGETLANVNALLDYLCNFNGTNACSDSTHPQLSARSSYPGTLMSGYTPTSSTQGTVVLASALTTALTAGQSLTINERLYAPATSALATDPGVQKFAAMVTGLGSAMAAYGPGQIELWNEPPWGSDCWDNIHDCYDSDPGLANELPTNAPNWGFVDKLQNTAAIAGIHYIWGGTNKGGGSASVLAANMATYTGHTYIEQQSQVTMEAMHPYGNNPEDAFWNQTCLAASPAAGSRCNILGNNGAMFSPEEQTLVDRAANGPTFGIHHVLTETGARTGTGFTEAQKAEFVMRQLLVANQDDLDYTEFYRLYDTSDYPTDTGFSFVTLTANGSPCGTACSGANGFTALPAYTAISGYMADVALIPATPAAYTLAALPSVSSGYAGTYQLAVSHVVGRRVGAALNSDIMTVWQASATGSSNCPGGSDTNCWFNLAAPAAASTTIALPAGMHLTQAVDTVTRAAVATSLSGQNLTLAVASHPVELLIDPASAALSATHQAYGTARKSGAVTSY